MKLLNFGSLNVDYVYSVRQFVRAGETIASTNRSIFSGGKGLNQSVAMAKTGVEVYHAGMVGSDGAILIETLEQNGVNTSYIEQMDAPSGHTVIQVDASGQNCIIVYGGTNQMISKDYIDKVLQNFSEEDYLLVQNETNHIAYAIQKAHEKGMTVLLNPSPCDESVLELPLNLVDYFIVNEIEGGILSGAKKHEDIIPLMAQKYPQARIVLTMGEKGSLYYDGKQTYQQQAFPANAVDTTAAGDTYLGYFVYGLLHHSSPENMLLLASKAASITVSRKGAAASIPKLNEVQASLNAE